MSKSFNSKNGNIAWCPGCGNFGILKSVINALTELNLEPENTVLVSGIGQAAKLPQYVNASYFNGLHGRSLPAATAIKASNPGLTVIAESGDGCTYGEGGNHFLATIRRNPDITNIVHNNMVYGLTKGQASPTTQRGFKTPVQINGVNHEPFNPIAVALSLNATFIARAYSGDIKETTEIIKKAINHKGYALVDIFQPCITYNTINNHKWYKDNTYYLDDDYDSGNKEEALKKAFETESFPLGIIYQSQTSESFNDNLSVYENSGEPLYKRKVDLEKLQNQLESKK